MKEWISQLKILNWQTQWSQCLWKHLNSKLFFMPQEGATSALVFRCWSIICFRMECKEAVVSSYGWRKAGETGLREKGLHGCLKFRVREESGLGDCVWARLEMSSFWGCWSKACVGAPLLQLWFPVPNPAGRAYLPQALSTVSPCF